MYHINQKLYSIFHPLLNQFYLVSRFHQLKNLQNFPFEDFFQYSMIIVVIEAFQKCHVESNEHFSILLLYHSETSVHVTNPNRKNGTALKILEAILMSGAFVKLFFKMITFRSVIVACTCKNCTTLNAAYSRKGFRGKVEEKSEKVAILKTLLRKSYLYCFIGLQMTKFKKI